MLRKHREFYANLLFMQDVIIISASWILSYYLRLKESIVPLYEYPPELKYYLVLLVFIILLWRIIFKYFRLYSPKGRYSLINEIAGVVKASTVSIILLTTLTYFFRHYEYSRVVFIYFWFISIVSLSLSRIITRKVRSYYINKEGNQRNVLIVGAEALGKDVLKRIKRHPDLGLKVVGFLASDKENVNSHIYGSKIIGAYDEIKNMVNTYEVELVIIALQLEELSKVKCILKMIECETVDIKIVPDFSQFITLRGETEEFDGLTLVNVQSSPLYGWNIVKKRIFDVVVTLACLVVSFPLLVIIALAVKTTSRGPLIYKQERMGMDGRVFGMYKFRSMKVDSEAETGPVWAVKDDPRRTWLGKILRNTSMDELPQLVNVIKGEMSLVGPRPERTVFIEDFKGRLPKYMLRHKVKAGMTGWAQVNGWRGDTSIEKRIEYDLHYIENWSVGLDIKIVLLTVWKGFINNNAY